MVAAPTPLSPLSRIAEALLGDRLGAGVYRDWVALLGLRGDERVLEVGCGAGACARHLAAAVPDGRLTCLEIDGRWLEIARRRLRRFGERIELVEADASLWSRPGSFDVIVIHFMLHDVPLASRDAVARLSARSLLPGGRLCMREPVGHGVSETELLAPLSRAGLTLERMTHERVPLMGPTVSGIWRTASTA